MNSFVYFRCGQVDLQESELHIVVHKIVSISVVLWIDDVFASVWQCRFNYIDKLHLRSDSDFLVTPQADLELNVQICRQVETVPGYFDFWWISFVNCVIREVDPFSGCCGGFCNERKL